MTIMAMMMSERNINNNNSPTTRRIERGHHTGGFSLLFCFCFCADDKFELAHSESVFFFSFFPLSILIALRVGANIYIWQLGEMYVQ